MSENESRPKTSPIRDIRKEAKVAADAHVFGYAESAKRNDVSTKTVQRHVQKAATDPALAEVFRLYTLEAEALQRAEQRELANGWRNETTETIIVGSQELRKLFRESPVDESDTKNVVARIRAISEALERLGGLDLTNAALNAEQGSHHARQREAAEGPTGQGPRARQGAGGSGSDADLDDDGEDALPH